MKIEMTKHGEIVVAHLEGRMDSSTAAEFDTWFGNRIQSQEARLVLGMSKLEYISSAGLRSLLAAAKRVKVASGGIVLCGVSGTVLEVIKVSGFQKIFVIKETVEEAVSALASLA